jgi:hypothetical protein
MVETRLSGVVSDATIREVTPRQPGPDAPDPIAGPGPKPGEKQFKAVAHRKFAAQAAPQAKPGVFQPPVFEAPPHPSLRAVRIGPPRHVEQSAGQISPKLLPIGTELQEAFKAQDLAKLLKAREELHRMLKSGALEGKELIEVRTLVRLADVAWEKFKALSLIAANGAVDQNTFGTDNNKSKAAFEAREQYRKEAVEFISKLTLEQCAQGSILARCEEHCHGADAVFRWEVGLEKDLLFHVGNAGWVSINQAKVDSGILNIVPRQQIDGQTLSGADILDLDKTGKQSFDSKYLQARLTEAVELAPAVYLRHIAFTEEKPELRDEAILNLQEMILPAHWIATRDGDVGQRFAAMQKQEGKKLKEKIEEIKSQNLRADKSQEALMKAEIEWSKDFAKRSYEFVKEERQAGRLQLSANSEKAFGELDGMYSGSDTKRAQLNHWLDIAAINAPMIALSGGVANIARAGVQLAIERYIVRSLGEEALARVTVKAGTYAVTKLAEGYVFQATESGLSYLGGNKDAFSNFWSDGLKSTVAFVGMNGAAKLAQSAIMGVAERTLSNEARIEINSLLNGTQRQAYLAKVIQANGKLRALNLAGHLTAEALYFALQGKTEAVIGGKPLSSLLSPAEWAEALGQSAMQVSALRVGKHLTKGIEQSFASTQSHIEAGNRVVTANGTGAADPVQSPLLARTVQVEDPLSGKIVTANAIGPSLPIYQNERGVVGREHIRNSVSYDAQGNVTKRVSQTGGKSFFSLLGNADGTYDLVPQVAGGSGKEDPPEPPPPPASETPEGALPAPPTRTRPVTSIWSRTSIGGLGERIVDIHCHQGGVIVSPAKDSPISRGGGSYSDSLNKPSLFNLLTNTEGTRFVIQRVPQNTGSRDYYLTTIPGQGDRPMQFIIHETARGNFEVPEIVDSTGRLVIRKGNYTLTQLQERLGRELDLTGDFAAYSIPDKGVWMGYEGLRRDIEAMMEIRDLPDELRQRVYLGLVSGDPGSPDAFTNILYALKSANMIDPFGQLLKLSFGETTLVKEGVTEHVENRPDIEGDGVENIHKLLSGIESLAERNLVGGQAIKKAVIVIHCDAGDAAEFDPGANGGEGSILIPQVSNGANVEPLLNIFRQHQDVNIIWAHGGGIGRTVLPSQANIETLERAFQDPALSHVSVDLSWDVAIKHILSDPQLKAGYIDLVNRYPDRFYFGSDTVGSDGETVGSTLDLLWDSGFLGALNPEAREKFLWGNGERLYNDSASAINAWRRNPANAQTLLNLPSRL